MSILTTIEADLTAAWGDLEAVLEVDGATAWAAVKGILTALAPEQWTILAETIATAAAEVAVGDISGAVTAVLNELSAKELPFAEQLGSEALTAVVAAFTPTPAAP